MPFPINSGTTVDLTPANIAQTFSVGTADGSGYFYTFTTKGYYKLAFTDTGTLNATPLDNPFIVTKGSTPGAGATVATSVFGSFASGASAYLSKGTYTLYVPTMTTDHALAGTLSATAAVPEPASWAMMLVGFGALGGLMRRRQTSVTAI